MKKTLTIFAYKNSVAAIIDKDGTFLNDINDKNQLGCVIDVMSASITQSAKDYIKNNYSREGGSFASFMLTKHANNESASIAIVGKPGYKIISCDGVVEIGRTCSLEVLDMIGLDNEIETSNEYVQFVNYIDSKELANEQ